MADAPAETFAPAGGRVIGYLGIAVVAVMVLSDVLSPGSVPIVVIAGAIVVAVLIWATTIRPRVSVADGTLVMRNMLQTIRIPLAAVEDLSVRQVLAVRTAQRRYACPGVGRSLRQALREKPPEMHDDRATRPALGPAFGGDVASQVDTGGITYADYVEVRLRDLIEQDRQQRRVRAYSEQAVALGEEVRREPAWPEIAALVAATVFFVVALLLRLT
jgi:hypothetical protein